ncbi:hypothetical protein CARUB_v10014646mg [Capsella rubella]|uniref:Cyclin-dependent kinase inhibitor n=1 Tax=Capsella rubella TaxID=81985 RepID=R0G7K8_9BRAS|nr:cyclin-dependent kinase inhibitor 6 isoform X2 [Capsella rubella]EOA31461.1 hypothetical protein CARUB_v10014646mg [Capsella rubella]
MSERKRELEEEEDSNTRVSSPLKKRKLDDASDSSSDSHHEDNDVVFVAASSSSSSSHSVDSSAALASDECSATSTAEENDQSSSSISSGCCFTNQSKEIAKNRSTFVTDLEAHQISETETKTSTLINSNFRETSPVSEGLGETTTEMESSSAAEVRKTPTPAEIEGFFSELENEADDKKKQFIEKYNFDIVNDEPLQGRYKWDRL